MGREVVTGLMGLLGGFTGRRLVGLVVCDTLYRASEWMVVDTMGLFER
jgi:hypothetical protein